MFFEGIVEDDNISFGYVKVRIFGKHNRDKSILPTEDLPDAKIVYSGESCVDEISYFRTICNGSWVIVSFLDKDEQKPIVIGSVVKTVDEIPDFSNGFTDKNGEHPSQTGTTISSESQPNYPHNRVLKTKKHIIEIDDTEGSERINIEHFSGAKISFDASGEVSISGVNNINLNGDADSIISYTDMKSAFDQFILDYNTHSHATAGTGTPSPPVTLTTADMSNSEVSTVKVP